MKQLTRPALRSIWVQVHLWLGLTVGVIGALIGVTGSILVYDHDLDHLLNPQRYDLSGPQVSLPFSAYAQRAAQALQSRARPTGIRLPDGEDGPVMVFARSGNGPFQRVYLDPPTGRVLDTASGRDYLGWLHSFHESLTLREHNGREIIGVVGIAMLISSLSGIYLWWPGRGAWRHAFRFRRGFTLWRNLHYTFGVWGALVLALLSFTGIFLAFPDAGRRAVAIFGSVSPSPRGIQAPEGSGAPIGPDEAVTIARALYPGANVIGLGLPAGPCGAYRVNVREPGDASPRPGTVVFIDPRSGSVLHRADRSSRTAGDAFVQWQRILHEGSAFGVPGRGVTFLGGLLPALLMMTGLTMWLRTRRGIRTAPADRQSRGTVRRRAT